MGYVTPSAVVLGQGGLRRKAPTSHPMILNSLSADEWFIHLAQWCRAEDLGIPQTDKIGYATGEMERSPLLVGSYVMVVFVL